MNKLVFITIVFSLVMLSCATSDISKEGRLQLIEKNSMQNGTTLYYYKYRFNGSAWMEIKAYVKKEGPNHIITINDKPENTLNTYTYRSDLGEQNLIISNRVRKEKAINLEDALKQSIFFYLADNI